MFARIMKIKQKGFKPTIKKIKESNCSKEQRGNDWIDIENGWALDLRIIINIAFLVHYIRGMQEK